MRQGLTRSGPGRGTKKTSSGIETKRRALHDLVSPGRNRVGVSTSISSGEETGCCGFTGPIPSATLDKIPSQIVRGDCRAGARREQDHSEKAVEFASPRGLPGRTFAAAP